ncbi:MAG: MBL fold metallo-hydrolase [Candidatus Thorarchaeota archaeon]|nr:MBL fold metallo-hydrolase [Candidatus Thorarchaeota archaeon]
MNFTEIGSGVFVIVGGSFPRCNTVVILGEENILIDPGCAIEDLRVFLQARDLEIRDIDTIILSHIHPDHITHTMRINRLSCCRIAANEITAPLFDDKEKMKAFLGFPRGHPTRAIWEQYIEEKAYGAFDEGRVDEVLHDGDKFVTGDLTLVCRYTPGHLPDHMCVEIPELKAVYASDIDCTEFGPFYGHPNSSIDEFRQSISMLRETDYDYYISGHLTSVLVPNYKEALGAYDKQFDIREDLVLAAIAEGATTVPEITITPIIYPSLTNPVFLQFERWMVEHHVENLIRKGLVTNDHGRLRMV